MRGRKIIPTKIVPLSCRLRAYSIFSLKTLCPIYISEHLFGKNQKIFYEPDPLLENRVIINNSDKIKKLSISLKKLIKNEKYESAAILRDKILSLKKNIK